MSQQMTNVTSILRLLLKVYLNGYGRLRVPHYNRLLFSYAYEHPFSRPTVQFKFS